MKKLMLPLALVAAAPLAAQDVELGVFIGQQTFNSFTVTGTKVEPEKKTVTGVRFGYSLVDIGPALFQLTAGYQPESKSTFEINGKTVPGAAEFSHKHWSVGAMFNFKAFVAVGAGVEYRSESLSSNGVGNPSTTYGRPWGRANIGFAFPTPFVKPFVGLEVAAPLTSTSVTATSSTEEVLKGNAPKFQVGLYGGIRF